jgi:hypothetical protein
MTEVHRLLGGIKQPRAKIGDSGEVMRVVIDRKLHFTLGALYFSRMMTEQICNMGCPGSVWRCTTDRCYARGFHCEIIFLRT